MVRFIPPRQLRSQETLDRILDAASERTAARLGAADRQALLALLGQVRAGAAER